VYGRGGGGGGGAGGPGRGAGVPRRPPRKRMKAIAAERMDYGEAYDAGGHRAQAPLSSAGPEGGGERRATARPPSGGGAARGTRAGAHAEGMRYGREPWQCHCRGSSRGGEEGSGRQAGVKATAGARGAGAQGVRGAWAGGGSRGGAGPGCGGSCRASWSQSTPSEQPRLDLPTSPPPLPALPHALGLQTQRQLPPGTPPQLQGPASPEPTPKSWPPYSPSPRPHTSLGAAAGTPAPGLAGGAPGRGGRRHPFGGRKLCSGCQGAGGECDLGDRYAGYAGAYRCLVEGRGTLRFTSASVWPLFGGGTAQPWSALQASEFRCGIGCLKAAVCLCCQGCCLRDLFSRGRCAQPWSALPALEFRCVRGCLKAAVCQCCGLCFVMICSLPP